MTAIEAFIVGFLSPLGIIIAALFYMAMTEELDDDEINDEADLERLRHKGDRAAKKLARYTQEHRP